MNRLHYFVVLLVGVTACQYIPAQKQVRSVVMEGNVTVVDRSHPVHKISLEVNGNTYSVEGSGGYSFTIEESDIYQLKLSGSDLYTTVQTFSYAELVDSSGQLIVPVIQMVEKKQGRRMLTFGGDAMMGRRYLEPRWGERQLIYDHSRVNDMKSVLAAMKPYFEVADVSAINLETILAEQEPIDSAPKSVVFYTHPDITEALEWMGVDYVSLGNNHTYDYLDPGLLETLDWLDRSSLKYSGAGLTEEDALKPANIDLDGLLNRAWGFVGWTGRVEPNQVAQTEKAGAAYGSDENIKRSLESGAATDQLDVVQYHGSREYSEGPSETTERRLKLAIDSGADLVIAHHPHVAQGFEIYNDKLIAYSLGNFAFDQFFYSTHAAVVLNVWMDGDDFYRAEVVPIHVRDYKPTPAVSGARKYVMERVARLSLERGLKIGRSGGHGVIGNVSESAWTDTSNDILFVGDFESFDHFGSRDRSWFTDNASINLTRTAFAGRYGLELSPVKSNAPVRIGLKTFMRVFPSKKMRIAGKIKATRGTNVFAYVQYRPRKVNRYTALTNEPFVELGSKSLNDSSWESFEFNFDAPDENQLEARFVIEVTGNTGPVVIDDVEVGRQSNCINDC